MKLYGSRVFQDVDNKHYPLELDILGIPDMEAAARYDHVSARFADNNHRRNDLFLDCDCVIIDIDNGNKKDDQEIPPEDWKTAEDVKRAFPDVRFYTVDSKSNMLDKGPGRNTSARPRIHAYFPTSETITDGATITAIKQRIYKALSAAIDDSALDLARFLNGVERPKVHYYSGGLFIDEWIRAHPEADTDDGQTTIEPLPDDKPAGGGPLAEAAQTAPRSGAMEWDDTINDDNTEWADVYAELKQRIPCSDFLQPSPKAPGMFCCPFCGSGTHANKTGALHYYPENNTFFCFACRKAGDVVTLYARLHDMDNGRAAVELADAYHIDRPGRQDTPTQATERPTAAQQDAGRTKPTRDDTEPTQAPTAAERDTGDTMPTRDDRAILADIEAWTDDRSRGLDMIRRMGFTAELAEAFNFGYAGAIYFEDFPEEALPAVVLPYPGETFYYAVNGSFSTTPAGEAPLFNPDALEAGQACFVCGSPADALAIIQAGGVACAVGGMRPEAAAQQLADATGPLLVCAPSEALAQALDARKAKYALVDVGQPAQRLRDDPEGLAQAIRAATGQRDILADFLTITRTRQFEPIATGLPGLDAKLDGGLISQTLDIIGAPPAQGKTVLATQILESMARAGRPCLYVNLEMSRDQLLARSLARICAQRLNMALPATRILQGYSLTPTQRKAVEQAVNIYRDELQGMHYMDGPASVTGLLDTIRKAAKAAKATGRPAPNICIDYLQITQGDQREDVKDKLQRLLLGLKDYARQNNAIVLAITAQNRIANADGKPSMAAGRDTSALEYSADAFLQLNPGTGGILDLYVVKNRFGRADETPLSLYLEGGVVVNEWITQPEGHHKAL